VLEVKIDMLDPFVRLNQMMQLLNEQMISNGYAVSYRQYMNASELKHYNMLLEKAKNEKVGVWRDRESMIECLNQARY